jgi:hypothetical protein
MISQAEQLLEQLFRETNPNENQTAKKYFKETTRPLKTS